MKVLEVSQLPDELASSDATKLLQAAIGNPVSLANLDRETLGIQMPLIQDSHLLASSLQFRMITAIVVHKCESSLKYLEDTRMSFQYLM